MQARAAFPNSVELELAHLRFESAQGDLPHARQVAKSLLQEKRTNILLWNEYAQVEYHAGKLSEVYTLQSQYGIVCGIYG